MGGLCPVVGFSTELEDQTRMYIAKSHVGLKNTTFRKIIQNIYPFPAELAAKLSPDSGIIRASVELMSTTDADRPRGVKTAPSTESQVSIQEGTEGSPLETPESTSEQQLPEQSTSGQSDAKRAKRLTREERENAMLPDLKPAPGIL